MPFRGVSMREQREAFLSAAGVEGANVRAACRAFGISPTTGYKWLGRAAAGDMAERSRRPRHSPRATPAELEVAVLRVRREHPTWGGRKIHHALRLGGVRAPQPNTITGILHRHGSDCGRGVGEAAGLSAFREGSTQRTMADGFQGSFCAQPRWALPPADGG
jgi:Homeodomain-like domain